MATNKISFGKCRNKCREIATQYNISKNIFDRIPMYFFNYFISSQNPLERSTSENFAQIDIIMVFMVINKFSPILIAKWYNAGGKDAYVVLDLFDHLTKVQKMFNDVELQKKYDLCTLFGYCYSFQLESKTLRYIDNRIVVNKNISRKGILFDPNNSMWKANLKLWQKIKTSNYFLHNPLDRRNGLAMEEVRLCMKTALRTGRRQ